MYCGQVNKLSEKKSAVEGLTPPINAAIIRALHTAGLQEQKWAWQAVAVQGSMVAGLVLSTAAAGAEIQTIIGLLVGGAAAFVNGILLAWRMRSVLRLASLGVPQQLRFLYFYAAERYVIVLTLVGFGLILFKMAALHVLAGFIAGQVALFAGRLILKFRT